MRGTRINPGSGDKAKKVGAADIEITDAAKGIIFRSSNGKRWRITFDDNGTPSYNEVI